MTMVAEASSGIHPGQDRAVQRMLREYPFPIARLLADVLWPPPGLSVTADELQAQHTRQLRLLEVIPMYAALLAVIEAFLIDERQDRWLREVAGELLRYLRRPSFGERIEPVRVLYEHAARQGTQAPVTKEIYEQFFVKVVRPPEPLRRAWDIIGQRLPDGGGNPPAEMTVAVFLQRAAAFRNATKHAPASVAEYRLAEVLNAAIVALLRALPFLARYMVAFLSVPAEGNIPRLILPRGLHPCLFELRRDERPRFDAGEAVLVELQINRKTREVAGHTIIGRASPMVAWAYCEVCREPRVFLLQSFDPTHPFDPVCGGMGRFVPSRAVEGLLGRLRRYAHLPAPGNFTSVVGPPPLESLARRAKAATVKALSEADVVVLVGRPGSGKSTVAATVAHQFAAKGWEVRQLKPGTDPRQSVDQLASEFSTDRECMLWIDEVHQAQGRLTPADIEVLLRHGLLASLSRSGIKLILSIRPPVGGQTPSLSSLLEDPQVAVVDLDRVGGIPLDEAIEFLRQESVPIGLSAKEERVEREQVQRRVYRTRKVVEPLHLKAYAAYRRAGGRPEAFRLGGSGEETYYDQVFCALDKPERDTWLVHAYLQSRLAASAFPLPVTRELFERAWGCLGLAGDPLQPWQRLVSHGVIVRADQDVCQTPAYALAHDAFLSYAPIREAAEELVEQQCGGDDLVRVLRQDFRRSFGHWRYALNNAEQENLMATVATVGAYYATIVALTGTGWPDFWHELGESLAQASVSAHDLSVFDWLRTFQDSVFYANLEAMRGGATGKQAAMHENAAVSMLRDMALLRDICSPVLKKIDPPAYGSVITATTGDSKAALELELARPGAVPPELSSRTRAEAAASRLRPRVSAAYKQLDELDRRRRLQLVRDMELLGRMEMRARNWQASALAHRRAAELSESLDQSPIFSAMMWIVAAEHYDMVGAAKARDCWRKAARALQRAGVYCGPLLAKCLRRAGLDSKAHAASSQWQKLRRENARGGGIRIRVLHNRLDAPAAARVGLAVVDAGYVPVMTTSEQLSTKSAPPRELLLGDGCQAAIIVGSGRAERTGPFVWPFFGEPVAHNLGNERFVDAFWPRSATDPFLCIAGARRLDTAEAAEKFAQEPSALLRELAARACAARSGGQ